MIEEFGGDFIQWLRGFYFVAKTGSVSRASEQMGRNQPAISHQIKCLESEFGVKLFDRSKGRMSLTTEGKVILEKTVGIFELIRQMQNEINRRLADLEGTINIATTHAVIQHYLPEHIAGFGEEHPKVSFNLIGGGNDVILSAVEQAEVDFGILNLDTVPAALEARQLFNTHLVLITAPNTRHIAAAKPALADIAKAPLIAFPDTSTITHTVRRIFAQKGLGLKEYLVLNNFDIVKKYVELDTGVAILDDYTLTSEDRKHFRVHKLPGVFDERRYDLVMLKRKYLSPAALQFLGRIQKDFGPPD